MYSGFNEAALRGEWVVVVEKTASSIGGGCYCDGEERLGVDFTHQRVFVEPILLGVLDNVESINPDVPLIESTSTIDSLLERARGYIPRH